MHINKTLFLGIRLWHLEWALLNYTSEILKVSAHANSVPNSEG